jgi:hypothetical protein
MVFPVRCLHPPGTAYSYNPNSSVPYILYLFKNGFQVLLWVHPKTSPILLSNKSIWQGARHLYFLSLCPSKEQQETKGITGVGS